MFLKPPIDVIRNTNIESAVMTLNDIGEIEMHGEI